MKRQVWASSLRSAFENAERLPHIFRYLTWTSSSSHPATMILHKDTVCIRHSLEKRSCLLQVSASDDMDSTIFLFTQGPQRQEARAGVNTREHRHLYHTFEAIISRPVSSNIIRAIEQSSNLVADLFVKAKPLEVEVCVSQQRAAGSLVNPSGFDPYKALQSTESKKQNGVKEQVHVHSDIRHMALKRHEQDEQQKHTLRQG